MKKFIVHFIITIIATLVILEILLRLIGIAGHTIPTQVIKGHHLLKPHASGYWIKGGLGEIKAHYNINAQGWNSVIDYNCDTGNKKRIAIIGDSFIEGLHVDVEQSIGRLLEVELGAEFVVHEYGRSGGNIVDFAWVYSAFVRDNYDFVYVLVSPRDLIQRYPGFMGVGKQIENDNWLRTFYNSVSIIRYLNINHNLIIKLNQVYHELLGFFQIKKVNSDVPKKQLPINADALSVFEPNVVFITETKQIQTKLNQDIKQTLIVIEHNIKPYNFGFDYHWNINGRKNCAKSISRHIMSLQSTQSP